MGAVVNKRPADLRSERCARCIETTQRSFGHDDHEFHYRDLERLPSAPNCGLGLIRIRGGNTRPDLLTGRVCVEPTGTRSDNQILIGRCYRGTLPARVRNRLA